MFPEISPNIFHLTIPMPHNPLKYLNAYLLRGSNRNCLIDTGFNREVCRKALLQALEELGVQIKNTDVLITHMHSDHSGLAPALYKQGARIWMSSADAEVITQAADWSQVLEYARINGLPEQDLLRARDAHPGYKYRPQGEVQTAELKDGDIISCAGYELRCLLTPGHSRGHVCFYSEQKGLLFAGDTLLQEITPNISQWLPGRNPLEEYLQSLQRLQELEVNLVLPGHRRLFWDHRGRIQELQEHHQKRLQEVLGLVSQQPGTALDIASRMTWDLDTPNWEEFPLAQKWFATGEALAHLSYLESKAQLKKELQGGLLIWSSPAGAGS